LLLSREPRGKEILRKAAKKCGLSLAGFYTSKMLHSENEGAVMSTTTEEGKTALFMMRLAISPNYQRSRIKLPAARTELQQPQVRSSATMMYLQAGLEG